MSVPETGSSTVRNCWVKVNPESVKQWRVELGGLQRRDEIMAFTSEEFHSEADAAWIAIGSPLVTLSNVWSVFSRVVEQIQTRRDVVLNPNVN